MYKFGQSLRRIDWIYSQYAETDNVDVREFVKLVNNAYYHNSAETYGSRYVSDIQAQYKKLISELAEESASRFIVDIGSGTGFEYDLLMSLGINFSHFMCIEPSEDMLSVFQDRLEGKVPSGVTLYHGHFSDVVEKIKYQKRKLLIINSALHHVIWLEEMLTDIKNSMQRGDLLVIAHEPNNSHPRLLMALQKILKVVFTKALINKVLYTKTKSSAERWSRINQHLQTENVLAKPMPAIAIRRVIDYGVGYKNDWGGIQVPEDFNEGFWNVSDLSSYFCSEYELVYYSTYRHFGDPNGNVVINSFNKIACFFLKNSGTNFIAAWKRV